MHSNNAIMGKSTNATSVALGLFVTFLASSPLLTGCNTTQNSGITQEAQSKYAKSASMPDDDYRRLYDIGVKTKRDKTVSGSDLSYIAAMLDKAPAEKSPDDPGYFTRVSYISIVFNSINYRKEVSPDVAAKIISIVRPYALGENPYIRQRAKSVLASLDSPLALPVIKEVDEKIQSSNTRTLSEDDLPRLERGEKISELQERKD